MYERISIDPHVCHGQACIRGTRIPVHQIVRMLANGDTIEELLEDYPSLKREDVQAALEYAAALAEEQVTPIDVVGPDLMNILVDDEVLWQRVLREQALLITTDKGFTAKRRERHWGILVVRLRKPNRTKIDARVLQAMGQFAEAEWPGLLVVMRDTVQSVVRSELT